MNWYKKLFSNDKKDDSETYIKPIGDLCINRKPLSSNTDDDINFRGIMMMENYIRSIKDCKLIVNRINRVSIREEQFSTISFQFEKIN